MPTQPENSLSLKESLSQFCPWRNELKPSYPLNRYILRRNVAGFPFAEKITKKDAESITLKLSSVLSSLYPEAIFYKSSELQDNEMQLLFEHLFLANGQPLHPEGGIFIDLKSKTLGLIHLEDHLTLFFHDNELLKDKMFETITTIDEQMQEQIPFAFCDEFGYITSSATNLGTGLSNEAIIHAPALNSTSTQVECSDKVLIHGLASEKQVLHDLIIATNKYTLGMSEKNIIESVHEMGEKIHKLEQEARGHLLEDGAAFKNTLSKSFGHALYCKTLDFHESLNLASILDLGLSLGLITGENKALFFDLFFNLRRAHLNAYFSQDETSIEEKRALLFKEKVKDLKLCI
jgi:protein arginine kinase